MRLFFSAAWIVLLLLAPAAHADERGPERVRQLRAELSLVMTELRAELRALDDLVDSADSRGVQRELHRKVRAIEELAAISEELSDRMVRAARRAADRPTDTVVIVEGPRPDIVVVDSGPIACAPGDFAALLAAVDDASFPDEKVALIRDAGQFRFFDVQQVKTLMGELSFGKNKVDVAASLYPRVVDAQNWHLVYAALTFDSEKDELRQRVGR